VRYAVQGVIQGVASNSASHARTPGLLIGSMVSSVDCNSIVYSVDSNSIVCFGWVRRPAGAHSIFNFTCVMMMM